MPKDDWQRKNRPKWVADQGVPPRVNEASIAVFQEAILATHGAQAELLARDHVTETFKGETVWEGEVLVFDLLDHPTATICYAWEVDGEVTAVLHQGPVDGPQAAVRASIMAEEPE